MIYNKVIGLFTEIDEIAFDFFKNIKHYYKTLKEIVREFQEIYDISEEELLCDIMPLINQFNKEGIVQIHEDIFPDFLTLELTKQCNERCVHCYIPINIRNIKNEISFSKIKKIITDFVENGGKEIRLTGGEVMVSKNFRPTVRLARSLNLQIQIFSNLLNMTAEMARFLSENNVKYIQTSLYGSIPRIHDSITKTKGSFIKTLNGIDLLIKEKIEVKAVCVLMKKNVDDFLNIIKLIKQKKCEIGIETMLFKSYENYYENTEERLTIDELKNTFLRLKSYDKNLFMDIIKIRSIDKMLANADFLTSPSCDGHTSIYITADGKMVICPLLQNKPIGNIDENSIKEAMQSSSSLEILNINSCDFKQCLMCQAYDYCKFCIGLSYNETGNFIQPVPHWCQQAFMLKQLAEEN